MDGANFHETQRFTQFWFWLFIAVPVLLTWWAFLEQIVGGNPVGSSPAPDMVLWIVFLAIGIGMPLFFLTLRMETTLDRQALVIAFRPFHRREIKLAEIKSAEAKKYCPIMEYGGWGIRWVPGGNRAYNVKGNRGVLAVLQDGRKIMVGSQKAEELARAIGSVMR